MLFSTVFLALTASAAHAAPLTLNKRIQQTIADFYRKLAAGGGLKCNPQSVTSFTTLLAAAGPCEQQDAADSMIQLAQSLNNDPEMIRLTQIFAQQPRNTAPASPLLAGLFQCQFQGASPTTFVGSLSVGAAGTVPFGLKSLSPLGSCKAHPSGPIADGTQLVDLVQDPGVSAANGTDSTPASSAAPETSVVTSSSTPETSSVAVQASSTAVAPPAATSTADFHLQNGLDAQKLNAQFKSLTATSSCTEGQQACVGGSFAQCVSGSFVLTPCAAGTVCAALPLVNKPGTSISMRYHRRSVADPDTDSDCEDESGSSAGTAATSTAAAPSPAASDFHAANGLQAQTLNAKFKTLTASATCTEGEQACIGTSFAQCVSGSFVLTPCSGGLVCAALPLVNKPGTSIACDTLADVQARISASGVAGGIAGL
ncbi:hypothetical protein B0H14DRAFT_2689965 [Mycena olivaceomarginata]|nr:hypothetical protein B0H14DRAFT_2689965 [Mycena olivaceomarginata]